MRSKKPMTARCITASRTRTSCRTCGGTASTYRGRPMVRSATLLIVMILAGGPAGPLACELWCATPAAENHHLGVGCQHASHTLLPEDQIASQGVCHATAVTA